jgi:hypothetical protein
MAGREDLIGYGRKCLVPPVGPARGKAERTGAQGPKRAAGPKHGGNPQSALKPHRGGKPQSAAKPQRSAKPQAAPKARGTSRKPGGKGGRRP